jgi:prevent-host-death family protein
MYISAVEFKQKCLKLMDDIMRSHEEIIVTKRGKPVVRILPIGSPIDPFGYMKGSVIIKDDIVNLSLNEKWEAEEE